MTPPRRTRRSHVDQTAPLVEESAAPSPETRAAVAPPSVATVATVATVPSVTERGAVRTIAGPPGTGVPDTQYTAAEELEDAAVVGAEEAEEDELGPPSRGAFPYQVRRLARMPLSYDRRRRQRDARAVVPQADVPVAAPDAPALLDPAVAAQFTPFVTAEGDLDIVAMSEKLGDEAASELLTHVDVHLTPDTLKLLRIGGSVWPAAPAPGQKEQVEKQLAAARLELDRLGDTPTASVVSARRRGEVVDKRTVLKEKIAGWQNLLDNWYDPSTDVLLGSLDLATWLTLTRLSPSGEPWEFRMALNQWARAAAPATTRRSLRNIQTWVESQLPGLSEDLRAWYETRIAAAKAQEAGWAEEVSKAAALVAVRKLGSYAGERLTDAEYKALSELSADALWEKARSLYSTAAEKVLDLGTRRYMQSFLSGRERSINELRAIGATYPSGHPKTKDIALQISSLRASGSVGAGGGAAPAPGTTPQDIEVGVWQVTADDGTIREVAANSEFGAYMQYFNETGKSAGVLKAYGCPGNVVEATTTITRLGAVTVKSTSTVDATRTAASAVQAGEVNLGDTLLSGQFTSSGKWKALTPEDLPNTIYEYRLETQRGEKLFEAASPEQALREAARAGLTDLSGDPLTTSSITSSREVKISDYDRIQRLRTAENYGELAYGEAWVKHSGVYGVAYKLAPDTVPVRFAQAPSGIVYLNQTQVRHLSNTDAYRKASGTEQARLSAAYAEAYAKPTINLPGGWSMPLETVRDAEGNVIQWGWDSLSAIRRDEIMQELERAATGTTEEAVAPDEGQEAAPEAYAGPSLIDAAEDPLWTHRKVGVWEVIDERGDRVLVAANSELGAYMAYYTMTGKTPGVYKTTPCQKRLGVEVSCTLTELGVTAVPGTGGSAEASEIVQAAINRYGDTVIGKVIAPGSVSAPAEEVEPTLTPQEALAQFEQELSTMPKMLQEAYELGGFDGYNAAVEVYNDTLRTANRLITAGALATGPRVGPTEGAAGVTELRAAGSAAVQELRDVAEATQEGRDPWTPEFQQKYAAVLQPGEMSDQEYARIAPFVTPVGIDANAAFEAGAPKDTIREFILATSSQEFRDSVESGDTLLLPYGTIVSREDYEEIPPTYRAIIEENGYPGLEEWFMEMTALNAAEGTLKNFRDAFYLNTMGVKHDVRSFMVAELEGVLRTDYKAGDQKPWYGVSALALDAGLTPEEILRWGQEAELAKSGAAWQLLALNFKSQWGLVEKPDWAKPHLSADEAERLNRINAQRKEELISMYENLQKAQEEWVASRPLLHPVFAEGPYQAIKDNPRNLLNPQLYTETIAATLPYTLATMGVMALGKLVGGPAGLIGASAFAFSFTMSVEGHQIYQRVLEAGGTREEAHRLMNTHGALSAAVETAGDAFFVNTMGVASRMLMKSFGKEVATQLLADAARRYGWRQLAKRVAKVGAGVITDFVNQGGQEAAQEMIANAAVRFVDKNQSRLEGVVDAFTAGVIGTGPFVLLPVGGQAARAIRGTTKQDLSFLVASSEAMMLRQRKVLHRVLAPLTRPIETQLVRDPSLQRKVTNLYVVLGEAIRTYAENSLRLKQVRKAISDTGFAQSAAELAALQKLEELEGQLDKALRDGAVPLEQLCQSAVDALLAATEIGKDDPQALRLKEMPKTLAKDIDTITTQLFGDRTVLVIEKEAEELEQQINVIKEEVAKGGMSVEQIVEYDDLMATLQLQYDELKREAYARYQETGEEVRVRGRGLRERVKELLLWKESPSATLEIRTHLQNLLETAGIDKPTVREKAVRLERPEPSAPKPTAEQALAAELYDAGYSLGELIRMAKDLPGETRSRFYAALWGLSLSVDLARHRAVLAYDTSKLYLTQTLPNTTRKSLSDAVAQLNEAQAALRRAIARAAQVAGDAIARAFEVDIGELITKAIEGALSDLNQAVAAVNTAVARARVFVVKDMKAVTVTAYTATLNGMDAAIRSAGYATAKAEQLLARDLPAAIAQELREAKESLEQAVVLAHKAITGWSGQATEAALGALRSARKGIQDALNKADRAFQAADTFIMETLPGEYVDVAKARLDRATARLKAEATAALKQLPVQTRQQIDSALGEAQAAVAAVESAIARSSELVVQRAYGAAWGVLWQAALSVDTAMRELSRLNRLMTEAIPHAVQAQVQAAATEVRAAVNAIGQALLATEHFLTETLPVEYVDRAAAEFDAVRGRIQAFATEIAPAAAHGAYDVALQSLEKSVRALQEASAALRTFSVKTAPQAVRSTVSKAQQQIDVTITQVRESVKEARDLVPTNARQAVALLRRAVDQANSVLSEVRTLLALAREGVVSLPGEAEAALDSATLALETAVAQAAHRTANLGRQLTTRAVQGVRESVHEVEHLGDTFTGHLAQGLTAGVAGQPKAESLARALKDQRAAEVDSLKQTVGKLTWEAATPARKTDVILRRLVEMELFKALEEVYEPIVSKRKEYPIRKSYASAVDTLVSKLHELLELSRDTELSSTVRQSVADVIRGLAEGDAEAVARAGEEIERAAAEAETKAGEEDIASAREYVSDTEALDRHLKVQPGFAFDPEVGRYYRLESIATGREKARRRARRPHELVRDGGRYIANSADMLVRSVQHRVQAEYLADSKNWGEAKERLELYRKMVAEERGGPVASLSDELLSEIDRSSTAKPPMDQEQRVLTWEEAREKQLFERRLEKLLSKVPWLGQLNDLLARTRDVDLRRQLMRELWDWLEEVYGREYLDNYLKTGEGVTLSPEELADVLPRGTLVGDTIAAEMEAKVGAELDADAAVREAQELIRQLSEGERRAQELDVILKEVDRILEENKDRPDDAAPPSGLDKLEEVITVESVAEQIMKGAELTLEEQQFRANNKEAIESYLQAKLEELEGPKEHEEKPAPPAPSAPALDAAATARVATQIKEEVATEAAEDVDVEEKEALEAQEEEEAVSEAERVLKEKEEEEEKARAARMAEIRRAEKWREAVERAKRAEKKQEAEAITEKQRQAHKRAGRLIRSAMAVSHPVLGVEALPEGVEPEVVPLRDTSTEERVHLSPHAKERIEEQTQVRPSVRPAPAIRPAIQPASQPFTQAQPAVAPAVQPVTRTQLQQQEQQEQLQQQQLATLRLAVLPTPPVPPIADVAAALADAYRRGIPILIWRHGAIKKGESKEDVWKAVINPEAQANLLTVVGTHKLPAPPAKYATGRGSAKKTAQWLGRGPRHKGSADLGVVDVFWGREGGDLRFEGKGVKTNVGVRMPGKTKGITVNTLGETVTGVATKVVPPSAPGPAATKAGRGKTQAKHRIVAASPTGALVPSGSVVWAAGLMDRGKSRVQTAQWYYLPPPYDGDPIPLQGPPRGALNHNKFEPRNTLQIIGRSRVGSPPARRDLGWAIIEVRDGRLRALVAHGMMAAGAPSAGIARPGIEHAAGGDAARRPSVPAKPKIEAEVEAEQEAVVAAREAEEEGEALALGGEESLELSDEPILEPITVAPKTRVGLPKELPKRKTLTEWDYATTLKGFDPYDFSGA